MEFKDVLYELRSARHLSQAKLAEKVGLSSAAIGTYENGTRMPSRETQEKLADFFVDTKKAMKKANRICVSYKSRTIAQPIALYCSALWFSSLYISLKRKSLDKEELWNAE